MIAIWRRSMFFSVTLRADGKSKGIWFVLDKPGRGNGYHVVEQDHDGLGEAGLLLRRLIRAALRIDSRSGSTDGLPEFMYQWDC
jgi:hypothetical protein